MICRSKLFNYRTFGEGYVVFISRDDFIRILLCGLFDHLEQRRFLFYTVDDECSTEYFVATVFGVDLCETENFGVSQLASQIVFYLFQIVHFFFRECEAFFLVVGFEGFDGYDRFRLAVGGEYVLVESFVHALQHRVVVGIFIFYRKIFLDAENVFKSHVLGDFYCVCTPRGNHFAAWADETAFQVFFTFRHGFSKKPAEFITFVRGELMVALYGNHALGRGSEKKNHVYFLILRFFCGAKISNFGVYSDSCVEKTLISYPLLIKKCDICGMIQIETIFDIIVKGFIIGVVVSAPLGPVGVLCIQRTLNKGRWYGFVTGLGASLSDIAYALLTGYGMSFVFDYINKNIFYLQLLGSIMLLLFGIYTFRSNPVQSIRPASSNKGSYFHNFITAFFVTLSNPLIIFLFIGLFARFAFVQPGVVVFEEITGYLAIASGALVWWLGITYFVNKVRTKFNLRGIWILNRVIGSIVMLVSVAGLIYTLLGESLY